MKILIGFLIGVLLALVNELYFHTRVVAIPKSDLLGYQFEVDGVVYIVNLLWRKNEYKMESHRYLYQEKKNRTRSFPTN